MTKEAFAKLAGAGVILLDGATGSNLTKAGMPKGISTEIWTLEHADILIGLQKAYLAAGSQIIYAPTFSANRISLSNFGYQDRVEELNTRLAALSPRLADPMRTVYIDTPSGPGQKARFSHPTAARR